MLKSQFCCVALTTSEATSAAERPQAEIKEETLERTETRQVEPTEKGAYRGKDYTD